MQQMKQVVYTPVDPDDAEFTEYGREKSEEQIDWEKFREEMRESNEYAKVTIYRQPTESMGQRGQKKLTYLFDVGLDEYQYSQLCARLRDEYGSGTYRMQGRDSGNVLRFNRAVTIEAPKVENDKGERQTIPMIIAEMRETMQVNQSMMADFMRGPNAMVDPMDQMTKMATAFATIFGAMGITPQQQQSPKTFMEELTQFKLMQEMFNGGEGGGESNLFSLLTETVKSFGPALGMAIAAGQKSGSIPANAPIRAALPNPANLNEQGKMKNSLLEMKPQIDFLVMQAKLGSDPVAVVDTLLPDIPDDALDTIEDFLKQENVIDICASVNPGVLEYRSWFENWRATMLLRLAGLYDDSPDGEPLETDSKSISVRTEMTEMPEMPERSEDSVLTDEAGPAQTSPTDVVGDTTEPVTSAAKRASGDNGNT